MSNMNNAQMLVTLDRMLIDMGTRDSWSTMEEEVQYHLKSAWRLLSDDPDVIAVFKQDSSKS